MGRFRNCVSRTWLFLLGLVCLMEQGVSIKIFILAGQSNMVGYASGNHLRSLIEDPVTAPDYAAYAGTTEDADFVIRDDVFIRYLDAHGNLTVGFGREHENPSGRDDSYFGPALGFGVTMGDVLDEDIFIIKYGYSSSSLSSSWRPPSSGGTLGPLYIWMMDYVRDSIVNITDYYAGNYQEGEPLEITGFVWFQGTSDVFRPNYSAEYEVNLRNLVADIRNDLGVPDLPFVIGELGIRGDNAPEQILALRQIQRSVADTVMNVALTETAMYGNVPADGFRPDGDYHYYGRADAIIPIGEGFAASMIELLNSRTPEPIAVSSCMDEGESCSESRDCCGRRLFCDTSVMTCQRGRSSGGRYDKRKRRERRKKHFDAAGGIRRSLRVRG